MGSVGLQPKTLLVRMHSRCSKHVPLSNGPTFNGRTCRALYPVLSEYSGLLGLWRSVGEGPTGSLYQFRWGPDCVDGVELVYRSPLRCICSRYRPPARV